MPEPTRNYPTPAIGANPPATGLPFPADGTGLTFDAGYPLTFAPDAPDDLTSLFPTVIPAVEEIIYQRVRDASSSRTVFPSDGGGLPLPAAFTIPPDVSLYKGKDGTYMIPVGENRGKPIPAIPVARGWPGYPGTVPAIGVAESTSHDDTSEDTIQGGFAGDLFATDAQGNVIATAAYYAEPVQITVVVELIHENRDERDRLHDQLRRVIFPLKHLMATQTNQVRGVQVDAEKQDLPQDELPRPIYVSLWTVTVSAEALIPTEVTPVGVIQRIDTTISPTPST